jgi:hypothetical protein
MLFFRFLLQRYNGNRKNPKKIPPFLRRKCLRADGMVIAQDFGNYCAQIALEMRAEKIFSPRRKFYFSMEKNPELHGEDFKMQLYFVWNAVGFYLECR